jgi:ribosome biogenesis protein ERB1
MSLKALGKRKAEPDSDSEGDFPEIHAFSDEAEDSGDEEILNELEEEQRLERELAEEQASDSDSDAGSDLSGWLARHSGLPDDAEGFTPGTSPDQDVVLDFAKKRRLVQSDVTGVEKSEWDEIDPEDDSEPDVENRVGNIPAHFYDDMPHVGYDINGKRIMKPLKGDELDKFLATVDGSAW